MGKNGWLIGALIFSGWIFIVGGVIIGFVTMDAIYVPATGWYPGTPGSVLFAAFIAPFAAGVVSGLFQLWMAEHLRNQLGIAAILRDIKQGIEPEPEPKNRFDTGLGRDSQ